MNYEELIKKLENHNNPWIEPDIKVANPPGIEGIDWGKVADDLEDLNSKVKVLCYNITYDFHDCEDCDEVPTCSMIFTIDSELLEDYELESYLADHISD